MRCPACGDRKSKVIDSRPNLADTIIRRRLVCLHCAHRFSTWETETHPEAVGRQLAHAKAIAATLRETASAIDRIGAEPA